MKTTTISKGSRQVVICEQPGLIWARLYVANGSVATLQSWKGKTLAGAQRWAAKTLNAA